MADGELSQFSQTLSSLRHRRVSMDSSSSSSDGDESVEETASPKVLLRQGSSTWRKDDGFVSLKNKSHLKQGSTNSPTQQTIKRFFDRQSSVDGITGISNQDDIMDMSDENSVSHQSSALQWFKQHEDKWRFACSLLQPLLAVRFLLVVCLVSFTCLVVALCILNSYRDADNEILKYVAQVAPTEKPAQIIRDALNFLKNLEEEGGFLWLTVSKLLPGYIAKGIVDFIRVEFARLKNEYQFSYKGFQNRVSITINTLCESNKCNGRLEFEMRTVKDVPLTDLIPNEAAVLAIQQAGYRVTHEEEGPSDMREKEKPCRCLPSTLGQLLARICCINTRKKSGHVPGFCLCLPRYNRCFCCGESEEVYLHCDPIIRLNSTRSDRDTKKFISDQVKNLLSEATSGSSFMGWEMGLQSCTKKYTWCLTYEQPISRTAVQNRKYRVLLADEKMIECAMEKEPWQVFNSKGDGNHQYTKYCDRRWFHLRTMGQILAAKKEAKKKEKSSNAAARKSGLDTSRWLNTFFIDTLYVVAPDPQGTITTRMANLIESLSTSNDGGSDSHSSQHRPRSSTVAQRTTQRQTDNRKDMKVPSFRNMQGLM